MAWSELVKSLLGIAAKHGFLAVLATSMFIFICWFLWKMFREIIKSKNDEIERLVEERDKLQDIILKNRLSSNDKKIEV